MDLMYFHSNSRFNILSQILSSLFIVNGCYIKNILGYDLNSIYTQISQHQVEIAASTQQTLLTLTLDTSTSQYFNGGDAYGFQISRSGVSLKYSQGLIYSNEPFGKDLNANPASFAQDMSNMVVIAAQILYNSFCPISLQIGYIKFKSGSFVSITKILDGAIYTAAGVNFDVHAVMICGSISDAVYIHAFQAGLLNNFDILQNGNGKRYYAGISCVTDGNNLYLQLGYIIDAQCNHQIEINNVVETFLRIALCHYTCRTCLGNTSTSCMTCPTGQNRTISSNSSCTCDVGYFDDGSNALCIVCSYTCQTCTSSNNISCLTCTTSSQRIIANGSCPCNAGYYDDQSSKPICVACDYTCENCIGSSKNSCLTCQNDAHRNLIINSCPCDLGYFDEFFDDDKNVQCQPCSQFCEQCSSYNHCLKCKANSGRILDDNNQCSCLPNYSLNLSGVCQCLASNFRQITNNILCGCMDGYFDTGQESCQKCHYSCNKCSQSNNGTDCVDCGDSNSNNRYFTSGQKCECKDGYFDDGSSNICQQYQIIHKQNYTCHVTCKECNGPNQDQCLTCDKLKNRQISNNSCLCQNGFYQNEQEICLVCLIQCQLCQTPKDQTQTSLNCFCNLNCMITQQNTQKMVNIINSIQRYTQNQSNIAGASIVFFQYLGLTHLMIFAPQIILYQYLFDYYHPELTQAQHRFILYHLYKSLIAQIFLLPQISQEQTKENKTQLVLFHSWNVTQKVFIKKQNQRLRLVGISSTLMYSHLPQLTLMVLHVVLCLLLSICARGRGVLSVYNKLYNFVKFLLLLVVDSNFIYLVTSAIYAISQTQQLEPSDYIQVFSLLYAYIFMISYTTHLIYVFKNVILFQKKHLSSQEDLGNEEQAKKNQFIALHVFFLGGLQFNTILQPLSLVLKQLMNIGCCVVIIAGLGDPLTQYVIIIYLNFFYLLFNIKILPFHFKSIGYLEIVLNMLYIQFLLLSTYDFLQVQKTSQYEVDGMWVYVMTIVIIAVYFVTNILKLILQAIQGYSNYKQDKLKKEQILKLAQLPVCELQTFELQQSQQKNTLWDLPVSQINEQEQNYSQEVARAHKVNKQENEWEKRYLYEIELINQQRLKDL